MRAGDGLRGKSAYLFWKIFRLDGKNTEEYEITEVNSVPDGYKIANDTLPFESKLWKDFWSYALDIERQAAAGVRNAQIEAPGTKFLPGYLYTINIEHDGGLRIDVTALPTILQGESMPK